MSHDGRGKAGSQGDLPWGAVTEHIPTAPDRAGLLAAAAQRATGLKPGPVQFAPRWRAAAIAAAAVGLALAVVLFGVLPGRRLPGEVAWATTEGYVLTYRVYGYQADSEQEDLWCTPNGAAFVAAVEQWAQNQGLAYQSESATPAVNLRRLWASRGTPSIDSYQIDLIGIEEGLRDKLTALLNPLGGVTPPEMAIYTLYFKEGGLTEAMVGRTVTINGTEYRFPQDFPPDEAQSLRYMFDSREELGDVRFIAFIDLVRNPPDFPEYSYGLGDIVRLEFDAAGNLVLTTLVETWNEGRMIVNRFDNGSYRSQYVVPPEGTVLEDFDYLEALRLELTPRHVLSGVADDSKLKVIGRDPPIVVHNNLREFELVFEVHYELLELAALLEPGFPKFTAEQVRRQQEVYDAARMVFDDWLKEFPQYGEPQRGETTRISGKYFGDLLYGIRIRHQADADTDLQQLLAGLSRIEGMPEPVLEQRENENTTERIIERFEHLSNVPLADPDPERMVVDPSAWTAREAFLLDVGVLGYVESEAMAGYPTEQAAQFEAAVLEWAAQHGVGIENPEADPGLMFQVPHSGVLPIYAGHYFPAAYQMKLLSSDAELADKLVATIEPLPGVWVRSRESTTLYYHRDRKNQLWQGADLLVNGARYRFPYDLSTEEVGFVGTHSYQPPGSISYWGYLNIGHMAPDHFEIADIARIEVLADGTLAVTDYRDEWPEGQAQRQELARRMMDGWHITVTAQQEREPGFDPGKLLLESVAPLKPWSGPVVDLYWLVYHLLPQERWLAGGDDAITAAERDESHRLYDAAEAILDEHKAAHPEYRASARQGNQFGWYAREHDEAMLSLEVWLSDVDDAAINGLRAQLAAIPGMPEPELRINDRSPE